MGPQFVALEAVGVRVMRDVQPMSGEALAIVGRGEQLVDQFIVGLGIFARNERLHHLGLGWQAKQIEMQATNQCAPISFR